MPVSRLFLVLKKCQSQEARSDELYYNNESESHAKPHGAGHFSRSRLSIRYALILMIVSNLAYNLISNTLNISIAMPTQQEREASAAQANQVIDIFHEISTLLVRSFITISTPLSLLFRTNQERNTNRMLI